jgi:YidC/Oxa1 family membrane protein insertase
MDKRMLLAIALSLAILIGYQYFFMPPQAPQPISQPPVPETGEAIQKQENAKPAAQLVPPAAAEKTVEKTLTVDTELYTAILSSRGGTLKNITLKKYKDKNGAPIVLSANGGVLPLSLGTDETFSLGNALFSVKGKDLALTSSSKPEQIVFEYSSGNLSARRTYTFSATDYGIELKDEVNGLPSYWITIGKDFGIHERDDSVHFGPVVLKDAERLEFKAKDLKEPKYFKEGLKWIATEDKYFFASIAPKSPVESAKVWSVNGDALSAIKMPTGSNSYLIYVGPKAFDTLAKYGIGLEHIVDFGFFSVLSRPLFWLLKQFYHFIPNYGAAIILLTIIVRIPFIPLINKGQSSMKKLQDIQPKMAEIREKYKKDPQKMQKEVMELYKKHKVNPMGGCLPMVLQIPVFFALYKVLLVAIELRGAPFMLWINDLSTKDPYYIFPIVMGATMVIQQRMTPSTMEPTQQKIMMLMPVIFTFMFLSFPSGLVLYWLVNNVLSIAQQFYINAKIKKQPASS